MAVELPSQTSIANNAISRVGSTERITSVDASQSPTAVRIKGFWPQLRRGMLVRHPFNFAIHRRSLNASSAVPEFGDGLIAYQLPEDCVRWLPPSETDRDGYVGEREGNAILTRREAPLPCRYIRDVDDVTRWSPGFVEGFTEGLAKLLAQPVSQSAAMAQWLHDTAEEAVRLAKRIDGLETGRRQRSGVVVQSDWLTARGRGRYGAHR